MTISQRPDVLDGQPFIAGTQVTVVSVLALLEAGAAPEDAADELGVTLADVRECQVLAEVLKGFIEGHRDLN